MSRCVKVLRVINSIILVRFNIAEDILIPNKSTNISTKLTTVYTLPLNTIINTSPYPVHYLRCRRDEDTLVSQEHPEQHPCHEAPWKIACNCTHLVSPNSQVSNYSNMLFKQSKS